MEVGRPLIFILSLLIDFCRVFAFNTELLYKWTILFCKTNIGLINF